MATLIKRAPAPVKAKPQVGDQIIFTVWVPAQNIGFTPETKYGKVSQVNRVTVDAVDENGNTWRVRIDEII